MSESARAAAVEESSNEQPPSDEYIIVAFAMDLTGSTPADEMFRFAATDGNPLDFDRYIMPYRNISQEVSKQLGASIVTTHDAYRVLIESNKGKYFEPRTVTEYSSMIAFIKWLEEKKEKAKSAGVILVYNDDNIVGTVTPILMHAITRYGLSESFFKVVKGFVNVSALGNLDSQETSSSPEKNSNKPRDSTAPIRKFGQRANARMRTLYQTFQKLSSTTVDSTGIQAEPTRIREVLTTVADEMRHLEQYHALVTRHYSLGRMFFGKGFIPFQEKIRRSEYRNYLCQSGVDLDTLQSAFRESVDSVKKIVENIDLVKDPEDSSNIVEIIVDFFKSGAKKQRKGSENPVVVVDDAGDHQVSVSGEEFAPLDGGSPHDDVAVTGDMNDGD